MAAYTAGYPGDAETPRQLKALADEYRDAALLLANARLPGKPLRLAPFRLIAIHAIELYLNALLRHSGHGAAAIRALQHDLCERAKLAAAAELQLRNRTLAHLRELGAERSYLVSRYSPNELLRSDCQVNRMAATLDEIARKVTALLPT